MTLSLFSPPSLSPPLLLGALGSVSLLGFGFRKLAETSKFQLWGAMVTRLKTPEKVVALTYDDGPNPLHTPRLLQVLEAFQVKATFFVIGRNVENHRSTAQQIHGQGHELGNHSYSHRPLVMTSLATIRREIAQTDDLLRSLGVVAPIHFRAPLGFKRFRLPWVLSQLQKTNVLWSVDPRDYNASDSETVVNHVLNHVKPGSIILLHDGGGDRSLTIDATAKLIPKLQAQGYHFRTVSELLALQS